MNFRVDFFKLEKEMDQKKKVKVTGEKHLGMVYVSDEGTSNTSPLISKAFRHAPAYCLNADKVVVSKE